MSRTRTASSMASSSSATSSYNTPCAACKFLRRKCMPGCIFEPYFPPEEPHKFANVHKLFGASNVTKLLNELPPHQREDAVNSLAYEAEARVRDPVYGCVGVISYLQRQVQRLQKELNSANADLLHFACNELQGHGQGHFLGGVGGIGLYDQLASGGGGGGGFGVSSYPSPPWVESLPDEDDNVNARRGGSV